MSTQMKSASAGFVLSRLPLLLASLFVVTFVLAPLALMLIDTLHGKDGWTLSAWTQLLATDTDRVQLWRTAQVGLVATAIALLLGAAQTWFTLGTNMPGAAWLG